MNIDNPEMNIDNPALPVNHTTINMAGINWQQQNMFIHYPALPVNHVTINIVGINWQQQNMFIHSAAFVSNMGIHHGQQPNLVPSYLTAILALLTFIVPVLINLIDLKFQKEDNSVFEAHPIAIMVAFASLLAFVLAFGIDFTFHSSHLSPTCAALLRTSMLFFGSLSLASLAALLLPNAFRPLLFVFYALFSVANLHNLVQKWYHRLFRTLANLHNLVQKWYHWLFRTSDSGT